MTGCLANDEDYSVRTIFGKGMIFTFPLQSLIFFSSGIFMKIDFFL